MTPGPDAVVRARRYVSAAAGTYPPPLPPRREAPPAPDDPDVILTRPPREPAWDDGPALDWTGPIATAEHGARRPFDLVGVEQDARKPRAGMLAGTAGGALVGLAASWLVLALVQSGDLSLLARPAELWRSTFDRLASPGLLLVMAGVALLGAGIGGRLVSGRRRRD
ncbi:MAG: hypothetical protein KBD01_10770 [Acidobacteria bacterium]|nr:hypothetical protein [Acidobacteriota bacterium]